MSGRKPLLTALALAAITLPAFAQSSPTGGTPGPETAPSQDTNAGGTVGSEAVQRPDPNVTNSVGKKGQDCQQIAGTSAQRPATAGAATPQPQEKCEPRN
jgi:hypothetical protein